MKPKLENISKSYYEFVNDQVLTANKLNRFITHLDQQDRLSRVFLSGVGIVCGFKLSFKDNMIKITPGVGVTTDGDLIQLKKLVPNSQLKKLSQKPIKYSFYKKFTDDSANYTSFRKIVGEVSKTNFLVLDMWELLPEKLENARPLKALPDINDKVVLLYLESFAKEGDLCTAIDCDNQGIEQINRLRVLLVSKADAEYIANNDSIFSAHNIIDNYFNLPTVAVKRVVLNQINTSKYEALKRAYYDAINSDKIITNLDTGIERIVTKFGSVLQLNISNETLKSSQRKLKDLCLDFSAYKVPFNIQYRYDFLKDIVDTYNEIKALLLDLKDICFPDIKAFRKHLMLGLITEIKEEPKHLRHSFYKSAALDCGCDNLEHAKNLVVRLFKLIDLFRTERGEIKITPSNKMLELSKRSVPFYYKINNDLLKSWDFFKTKKFEEKTNLSYHKANLATYPHIQEPLNYNIDKFDFYRIEGHQGKDYRDVLEKLDDMKTKYGLAFDVKALSVNINRENLDIDDYKCEFEDLKVLLKAWTGEQDCILAQVASFFSSFSTAVPGSNVKESELDLKKKVAFNTLSAEPLLLRKAVDTTAQISSSIAKSTYQSFYEASSVISDNLSTTKDTLGVEIKMAIEENKGGSVNDIIASAQNKLIEKVSTEEWQADADLKVFVVDKGVELLAHTHVLTQQMPGTIAVIDTTKVNSYKLSLSQLCELVKKLKAGYQSTQLSVEIKAFIGLLINQLSTVCCSGKKLEVLLDEVNKRKEQILLSLQLSKFVEKHRGLEHLAGVQQGGTFVLVYKNREIPVEVQGTLQEILETAKDASAKEVLVKSKEALSSDILNMDKLSTLERTLLLRRATELMKYGEYLRGGQGIEELAKVIPTSNVPNNTVVADFALPYMCCSDCATVNFIVAKQTASLRLEKDKYCLLTDTAPVLFDVEPKDGVIKSDPETEGLTIDGNKLNILSDKFPEDLLGKPIRFTVNSQVTDAEITVYKGIQADFNVPETPTSEATHTFIPTGDIDGANFFWDFGDGQMSTDRNPTQTYKLPVNLENKATVTLTVTAANGFCQAIVEHKIQFEAIKPTINLGKREFCEKDKGPFPFIVTPDNVKVEIIGDGVKQVDSGGYVFDPTTAGVGNISFTVNEEPSELSVTVSAAPVAAFKPEQQGNVLVLNNESTNAEKFVWIVNGTKYESDDLEPYRIVLTTDSPTEWKLRLVATGAEACPVSQIMKTFRTKYNDELPVENCLEETEANIVSDLKILQELKPDATSAITDIWEQTAIIYGGTADFKEGVLNHIEKYLTGGANNELDKLFTELLKQTSKAIIETDRERQKENFTQLVLLFELQLRLFYNILGCQGNDIIKKFQDIINGILGQIIDSLHKFKKQKVVFSDRMKDFIEKYKKKVADIVDLNTHLEVILDENLI